jgi:hypothetical protein
MVDRSSDEAIESRLRAFLAAELRQAESDYPHMSTRKLEARRGTSLLGLSLVVVCLVAAVALARLWGEERAVSGADPLGPDGLPLSIGGVSVLRGGDIETRVGLGNDTSSFLAGGYLILHPTTCASIPAAPSGGCLEDWRLDDVKVGNAAHSVRVSTAGGGVTFVRTSGAPTVLQVKPIVEASSGNGTSAGDVSLLIEAVAWRQPTKGPIPENAAQSQGGAINEALVPDFVSVWGGPDGETIVGYSPKDLLLNPTTGAGGTPENPPQELPVPVYGEDLTTLVGNMVPGHGFVPLGASPLPSIRTRSDAPSTQP